MQVQSRWCCDIMVYAARAYIHDVLCQGSPFILCLDVLRIQLRDEALPFFVPAFLQVADNCIEFSSLGRGNVCQVHVQLRLQKDVVQALTCSCLPSSALFAFASASLARLFASSSCAFCATCGQCQCQHG